MHHAKHVSMPAESDNATIGGLEKHPRTTEADLGFPAPRYILDDTIPVTDPKLIYSKVHAQRDRRLRLLIRRYTNQIQYGCRNVNCSTPSCLSYRKRNSTGPLRIYTDLSARTLACQLVDDHHRSGKDPALDLCQNEPVVPWYEDPTLAKKRRNSHEKLAQHRPENGYLSPTRRQSQRRSPVRGCVSQKSNADNVVEQSEHLEHLEQLDGLNTDSSVKTLNNAAPLTNAERKGPRTVQLTSHIGSRLPPRPSKPKDPASFTQTLFDLMPLTILGWLPRRTTVGTRNKSDSNGHKPETGQDEAKQQHAQEPGGLTGETPDDNLNIEQHQDHSYQPEATALHQKRTGPSTCIAYSLSTLNWKHLTWLASPSRSKDLSYQGRFIPFMKQSLAYCLSDPERLVRSARNIQEGYPLDDSYGPQSDTGKDRSMTRPSLCPWPLLNMDDGEHVHALLWGLGRLEKFEQRDLVLTSIFTALQHSYALPPWLQKRRSDRHSRSSSISHDEVTSKKERYPNKTRPDVRLSSDIPNADSFSERNERPAQLVGSQITELCLVVLLVLATTVFNPWSHTTEGGRTWTDPEDFSYFDDQRHHIEGGGYFESLEKRELPVLDTLNDWSVNRLLSALMDVVSHRLNISKWAHNSTGSKSEDAKSPNIVDSLISRFDRHGLHYRYSAEDASWMGTVTIELVETLMRRSWDRSAVVQRVGPVGGALELLAGMYRQRQELNINAERFHFQFIAQEIDEMTMPIEWLSFKADNRQTHLLSYSFLFHPEILVKYFRSINIATMKKSHEEASIAFNETRQYVWTSIPTPIPVYGVKEVLAHLRPHMAKFFVLTARRDDLLNDAINQIWRRQRRELMRPLRVRIGKDEGEQGLDHGGVQQEFFRLVFAEAFRSDYGMFTVDSTTRMTWFQPGSFEPLYRFEALGILMSLAVYNGITLPVTMPLAFYRKILSLKVKKLEHIEDGWPELTKGLRTLLNWSDGDVGDIIARTYEFSYELCGTQHTVNMQKFGRNDPWPPLQSKSSRRGKEKVKSTSFELPLESELTPPIQSSPDLTPSLVLPPIPSRTPSIDTKGISTPISIDSETLEIPATEEAALVTNANRDQYVKDYILWLTHKSIEPQYEAFARGFYTCLDRTALSIFTPEALKSLVEGSTEIDIDELETTITYDDYTAQDRVIQDFWHVVHGMTPDQHRRLLEFVTASDRVPVNGLKSVTFIVQRNGEDDARLPSSSTCYGRLLLPAYSSREILEEKLTKAIENSVGFGVL